MPVGALYITDPPLYTWLLHPGWSFHRLPCSYLDRIDSAWVYQCRPCIRETAVHHSWQSRYKIVAPQVTSGRYVKRGYCLDCWLAVHVDVNSGIGCWRIRNYHRKIFLSLSSTLCTHSSLLPKTKYVRLMCKYLVRPLRESCIQFIAGSLHADPFYKQIHFLRIQP